MECTNNWMVNYRHCGYITCPLGEREGCEETPVRRLRISAGSLPKSKVIWGYLDALVNGPWTISVS